MQITTTTDTELSALATPVAEAPPESDDIAYPEGHWIAQSVAHGDAVLQATAALRYRFRERKDVLVAMELVVYYKRGNNKVSLQPDVQVVFGVSRGVKRSTFRVWDEGKAPDFVLEVASPSTAGKDAGPKAGEYARIGVREYWRLDPDGSLMETPLKGYVASGGKYGPVQPLARAARGGWLRSEVLGLELRSHRQEGATVLVFRDPRTGEEFNGAPEEAERRRQIAERDLRAAERELLVQKNRASASDERVRVLEEQLRALTADSAPPERDP